MTAVAIAGALLGLGIAAQVQAHAIPRPPSRRRTAEGSPEKPHVRTVGGPPRYDFRRCSQAHEDNPADPTRLRWTADGMTWTPAPAVSTVTCPPYTHIVYVNV